MARTWTWRRISCAALLAITVIGCTVEQSPSPSAGSPAEEVFKRTAIRVNEDGSTTVLATTYITASQQRAQVTARERWLAGSKDANKLDIVTDAFCGFTTLWVFDRPGLTGHEICLQGPGLVNLGDLHRDFECTDWSCCLSCFHDWYMMVYSYWAGSESGAFKLTHPQDGNDWVGFAPYQRVDNVDGWPNYTDLTLDNPE